MLTLALARSVEFPLATVPTEPRFFSSPAAMRRWLQKNHKTAREVIVGYHKVHAVKAGRKSLTWPESVAEALCFGWIDGIRRSLDADRYTIRFTPRRPTSNWSAMNIRIVTELEAAGRMTDAGRAVFASRKDPESPGYAVRAQSGEFDAPRARRFRRHKAAWKFFESQPPRYRKRMAWWVMDAKQDATRERRLDKLIELSAAGRRAF